MSMTSFAMVLTELLEERAKIKILIAGSLSKAAKISGFTLIELIVVVSIIAILLSFSFPVFRDIGLFSDSASQNVDFILHLDSGSDMVWVTNDAMEDEEIETAKEKGVQFSDGLTLLDVKFPGIREAGTQEYQIRFRNQGYSDFALIHIIEDEKNITLKIGIHSWGH